MINYITQEVSEFEKNVFRKMADFEIVIIGKDGVRIEKIPGLSREEALNEAIREE